MADLARKAAAKTRAKVSGAPVQNTSAADEPTDAVAKDLPEGVVECYVLPGQCLTGTDGKRVFGLARRKENTRTANATNTEALHDDHKPAGSMALVYEEHVDALVQAQVIAPPS